MKKLIYLLLLLPALLFAQKQTVKFDGTVSVTYETDAAGNVTGGTVCFGTCLENTVEVETSKEIEKPYNFYGFNVSTEADSLVSVGAFQDIGKQRMRAFYLKEKDQKGEGVYRKGGVSPKNFKYYKTPGTYRSVDWDGTFYANKFRYQRLAERCSELTLSLEVILNGYGDFRKFPRKDYEYWELGSTDKQVYNTVYDYTEKFFIAHEEIIESKALKFLEPGNESWLYNSRQWANIEKAFMDARTAYNNKKGRKDYKQHLPQLGTNALPMGQGTKYPLSIAGIVTPYADYYSYVNVHTYPIDSDGRWSTDFSIVAGQIDEAIAFQQQHFPNAHIRITETGAENLPNDINASPIDYYRKLDNYLADKPIVQAVFGYSLVKIPNSRFGKCFLWDRGKWNAAGIFLINLNKARNRA